MLDSMNSTSLWVTRQFLNVLATMVCVLCRKALTQSRPTVLVLYVPAGTGIVEVTRTLTRSIVECIIWGIQMRAKDQTGFVLAILYSSARKCRGVYAG